MTLPRIAITLGDPAGIGPEVALKAAIDPKVLQCCTPVLVGDRSVLERHAAASGITKKILSVDSLREANSASAEQVTIFDLKQFRDAPLRIGEIHASHGQAAVEAGRVAIKAALDGDVDAVVACPQTELAIKQAGIEFDGYPTFVARCTGVPVEDAFLLLCFDDKYVAHVTLHVSLKRAISLVTRERVLRVIRTVHDTLIEFGKTNPQIAVSGLNPHAGESGMFGDEEITTIQPAIRDASEHGISVVGPIGADTMFQRSGYDGFVVMFHDQGHIAAKLLATNRTAGMTIGTPVLFSSVAHGSALDIAGRNKASPAAVIEAVERLAGAAVRRRRQKATLKQQAQGQLMA